MFFCEIFKMISNKELVYRFYEAFGKGAYQQMMDCYDEDIIYNDPLVGMIERGKARAYWKMICTNAQDISLSSSEFEELDAEYITCKYQVRYFFPPTGKQVQYSAKAFMRIRDEKIIEHSDGYRLSSFIGNAYGITGKLFGWTGYMKKKIQYRYHQLLEEYV